MDGNIVLIIIVIIFAAVVLVWALRFRGKGKASIEAGPVKMSVEGENPERRITDSAGHEDPAPAQGAETRIRTDTAGGVSIEDAKAGGGILAEASDGGGVAMKGVEAGDDIIASASNPDDAPKARRP